MTSLCLVAMDRWISASTLLEDAARLTEIWLVMYAAYLLLCTVHEFGHWSVGVACGFHTREFRVGCVRWRDGWGVEWGVWNILSGWVRMQITRPDDMLRLRRLLFTAAGPAANVLFAVMLYPIAIYRSTLGGVAKYLLAASLFIAIVNLIPMNVGRLKSDGRHIFEILFDRKGFEAVRFQTRCSESAPKFRQLKDDGDWKGLKQLAEQLLDHGEGVRGQEELVQQLGTLLFFANGQIDEMGEISGSTNAHELR